MELTKEYFEEHLASQLELNKEHFEEHLSNKLELNKGHLDSQIGELNHRLDNIVTNMVTKDELKAELTGLSEKMEEYTNSVAETIIEAVGNGFRKVDERLTQLESIKQI